MGLDVGKSAHWACVVTLEGELLASGPIPNRENAIDGLASRCGLAPRNRRSGTSIPSVSASRQGNKRLKNLLVFSSNCLARSRNRWGE